MKATIHDGSLLPLVATGLHQCQLLRFAERHPGWHAVNERSKPAMRALEALAARGFIEWAHHEGLFRLAPEGVLGYPTRRPTRDQIGAFHLDQLVGTPIAEEIRLEAQACDAYTVWQDNGTMRFCVRASAFHKRVRRLMGSDGRRPWRRNYVDPRTWNQALKVLQAVAKTYPDAWVDTGKLIPTEPA